MVEFQNRYTKTKSPLVDSKYMTHCNYLQAFHNPNLLNVMKKEYKVLMANQKRILMTSHTYANVINCMWLFKNQL